jgi:hypothetical protein
LIGVKAKLILVIGIVKGMFRHPADAADVAFAELVVIFEQRACFDAVNSEYHANPREAFFPQTPNTSS